MASLAVLSVALLAAAGRNRNAARAARVGVSLLFVLPALVAGTLHLVGLSTTVESVPWARAALASPLAACLEFTLVRIEARALALGFVGALAPFAVIVLERRSERGAA